jgi:SAM-dependent methyltransferase
MSAIDRVCRQWNGWAKADPLWAILRYKEYKGGAWPLDEFFASGKRETERTWTTLEKLHGAISVTDVLDFGCGVGRLTQAWAGYAPHVVGLDVASSMIEQANAFNTAPGVEFVLNKRADLQIFADASFDLVNASIVLQHMATSLSRRYLTEFARVLRPGGFLVFTTPTEHAPTFRGRAYRYAPRSLIHVWKRLRDGGVMEMHPLPLAKLAPFLTARGFRIDLLDPSHAAGSAWIGYRVYATRR